MKGFLKHPLGPIPWSPANVDGKHRKTNKAGVVKSLQKNFVPVDQLDHLKHLEAIDMMSF